MPKKKLLSPAALLFLEDQEKMEKKQAKEEITPTRKMKARTVWVREWLTRGHYFGHYDQLLTELHKEDPRGYSNYLIITPDLFQEMVKLIPHLEKKTTFMKGSLMNVVFFSTLKMSGRGTQAGNHPSLLSYWEFVSKSTVQLQS